MPTRPQIYATGLLATALCLLGTDLVHALDAIDTDGPDYVESSEVVPQDHTQYEVDLTSVRDRRAASTGNSFSTPGLLKYGIARDLELRFAPSGYMSEHGQSGLGDSALGVKWHSQDRDPARGLPAVSWIAHVDIPSGAKAFEGVALRPSLRSVLTWDLPHEFALGLMPGIKSDTDAQGHRYTSAIFGAVLNRHLNDQWRAFIEASAPQIAHASDGGILASWDIGTAYLVNNDLQLGARGGVAANRNTPSSFVLFEIAQRFQ